MDEQIDLLRFQFMMPQDQVTKKLVGIVIIPEELDAIASDLFSRRVIVID